MVTNSPKFELYKLLVCKFVKEETLNWGREVKIAKKLIEKYPDPEFWMGLDFGWRTYTLGFFLKGRGAELLKKSAEEPKHPVFDKQEENKDNKETHFEAHPDLMF